MNRGKIRGTLICHNALLVDMLSKHLPDLEILPYKNFSPNILSGRNRTAIVVESLHTAMHIVGLVNARDRHKIVVTGRLEAGQAVPLQQPANTVFLPWCEHTVFISWLAH